MKDWIKRIVRRALRIASAKSAWRAARDNRQDDRVRALYATTRRFPAAYDRPAYLRRPRVVVCD